MKRTILLDTPERRNMASQACQEAPEGYVCTIGEPKRNEEQSALFHAICTDIAKSGKRFLGKPRTKDEWKVLLVSGHATATKLGSEMVPGLEGEFVNLKESTSQMSKKRMTSLCEYSLAWCANEGIEIKVPCAE